MKKALFYFLAFGAFTLGSCSSDDDSSSGNGSITANVNGVARTFNDVEVIEHPYEEEGYTDLQIIAALPDDPEHFIELWVTEGDADPTAMWQFGYYLGNFYHESLDGFNSVVTENSNSAIKGTFSGQVRKYETTEEPITITNGSFNIER